MKLKKYFFFVKKLKKKIQAKKHFQLCLAPLETPHRNDLALDEGMIWKDWESLNRTDTDIYYTELCKQIQNEDKIRITIRLEGSTFMELKRFLRVSFTDQLGSIGGTLGLFSGFSLLAIVELIHWVCMIVCSIVTRRHGEGAFSD